MEQGARVQISDFNVCNLVHLILLSLLFICPHTPLSLQLHNSSFQFHIYSIHIYTDVTAESSHVRQSIRLARATSISLFVSKPCRTT